MQVAIFVSGERQMADSGPISFGDRVRVRETPATGATGLAGLVGDVYGETTPSVTGVKIIGDLTENYAVNVHFEGREGEFWFNPDDLEFVDHAPGTAVTLKGVDKTWVRTESGEWEEVPGGTKHRSLWARLTGSIFKRWR
jgi:hypothetical protein